MQYDQYLGEEYPEDIIEEEASEQESGDLETGQSDKCYEGNTETHAHEVHQRPVTSEYPDTHHTDGDGHTEQLRHGEPPAHPQRYLTLAAGAGSHQVLTHGEEEEGEGNCGDHCGADCEQQLHGVKEEEHDEEGEGSAKRETHCLQTVKSGHVALLLIFLITFFTILIRVFHGQRSEGAIHNQQNRDEEGGDSRGVHDIVGQSE